MKITSVRGREILDSRGNPTVEADVVLENGAMGRAAVPSGASTGTHEAMELRDGDAKRYGGKGVLKAVANVAGEIAQAVIGMDAMDQKALDEKMIALDGTPNKGRLGANAILAVSLAAAKAAANDQALPLFEYVGKIASRTLSESAALSESVRTLPVPLMNLMNGGAHAANSTDIQEFMVVPVGAKNFAHAVEMGATVFHALKKILAEKGYPTTVGDEGGFSLANTKSNEEALNLLESAVTKAGYALGTDIAFALDAAASEFYKGGAYHLAAEGKTFSSAEMIDWLLALASRHPIISIEDGLAESDWAGWSAMAAKTKLQLVGDDIFVTNTEFLKRGIAEKTANAILIKLNQIGTLTETIACVQMAQEAGWKTIISHRSGETEDTTIAHVAVGLGSGQIKTGSLSRTDRVAKYNELMRIEEMLGAKAVYPGGKVFGK